MKVATVLAVVLLAAAAIAGTYWIARSDSGGASPEAAAAGSEVPSTEPTPSKTGPHPKVVLPEDTFQFDLMAVGETRKHTFVVKNEGEAPLKLGKPTTTCQCTVSEAAKNEIPPGGEGTIELEWKPTGADPEFSKGATIRTNDPKKPEIHLTVKGMVDDLLQIEPAGTWNVGQIAGDIPSDLSGFIFSRLRDQFAIKEIKTSNPLLSVTTEPIDQEKLKEQNAKSGYRLLAKLAPGMPAGRFSEKVVVKTDLDHEEFDEITFDFVGTRRGPVQILPAPGTKWNDDSWAIDLGRFPGSKGNSAAVTMFITGMPEGEALKFESVKSSEPYVTVELRHDEASKSSAKPRYRVTFRVTPDAPVATHRNKGAVKIEAATNHPEIPSMKFSVHFVTTP